MERAKKNKIFFKVSFLFGYQISLIPLELSELKFDPIKQLMLLASK